jgi:hypothetical protein
MARVYLLPESKAEIVPYDVKTSMSTYGASTDRFLI